VSSRLLAKTATLIANNFAKSLREEILEVDGQIFILNIDVLVDLLKTYELKPRDINNIVGSYKRKLQAEENSIANNKKYNHVRYLKNRLGTPGFLTAKNLPKNHVKYCIKNYRVANNIKALVGKEVDNLLDEASKYKGDFSGQLRAGDKVPDKLGFQLGHGDFGVAVSGARVMQTAKLIKRYKSVLKRGNLAAIVANYENMFNISSSLKLNRLIDDTGNFTNEYVAIISNELLSQNQAGGKEEARNLEAFKKAITDELNVLQQQSSPLLIDDIESVVLHSFAKQKNIKVKSKNTPKASIKRTSTGKGKPKKVTPPKKPGVIQGGAVDISARKGSSGTALDLRSLIPAINEKLPLQVAKNMGSPRLNYQTGRFAGSAQVVDIQQTAKGYPSVHYTYQRSPYQVFEYPTGSPRLATPDRDPRSIIDLSIREIATDLIKQRFYTKRV